MSLPQTAEARLSSPPSGRPLPSPERQNRKNKENKASEKRRPILFSVFSLFWRLQGWGGQRTEEGESSAALPIIRLHLPRPRGERSHRLRLSPPSPGR